MSCSLLQPYCQSFQLKITNTSVKKQWPWKSYDWLPPSAILSANTPTLVPVLDRERARLRGHKAVARVELRKPYQNLGYFLLPTAMCIFTSDLLFGGLPCGLWKFIAEITRVIEYMQSCFCSRYAFLSAFYIGLFDRNLASKPILCTYLSVVKSLLPCVV